KTYDSNVDAFNSNVNQANTTIDEKLQTFNETLERDGFTTPEYVENKFTEKNWQKFKLTNDDGTNFYDSSLQIDFDNNEQLTSLPIGTRYVALTLNNPPETNNNGWLTKLKRGDDAILIRYQPYNSTVIYQKRFYKTWSGWERVGSDVVDTGWVDLQLVNSASPHNDLVSKGGFTSAYRTITQNGITRKMIRINATTIKHGQTIAMLPKEFVRNLVFFSISAPRNKNNGRISLNTSGTVNFDATVDPSAWTDTDYIYGQYEWTE
ncbi:MAG: pyocin knob domain-containing protein, partial [Staphylococcus lugdunensis]|nr:pyocin knob domain-containing protein [Staphylococcus lugdunensis]